MGRLWTRWPAAMVGGLPEGSLDVRQCNGVKGVKASTCLQTAAATQVTPRLEHRRTMVSHPWRDPRCAPTSQAPWRAATPWVDPQPPLALCPETWTRVLGIKVTGWKLLELSYVFGGKEGTLLGSAQLLIMRSLGRLPVACPRRTPKHNSCWQQQHQQPSRPAYSAP